MSLFQTIQLVTENDKALSFVLWLIGVRRKEVDYIEKEENRLADVRSLENTKGSNVFVLQAWQIRFYWHVIENRFIVVLFCSRNILMGWWTHPIVWWNIVIRRRQAITHTQREHVNENLTSSFSLFFVVQAAVTDEIGLMSRHISASLQKIQFKFSCLSVCFQNVFMCVCVCVSIQYRQKTSRRKRIHVFKS